MGISCGNVNNHPCVGRGKRVPNRSKVPFETRFLSVCQTLERHTTRRMTYGGRQVACLGIEKLSLRCTGLYCIVVLGYVDRVWAEKCSTCRNTLLSRVLDPCSQIPDFPNSISQSYDFRLLLRCIRGSRKQWLDLGRSANLIFFLENSRKPHAFCELRVQLGCRL